MQEGCFIIRVYPFSESLPNISVSRIKIHKLLSYIILQFPGEIPGAATIGNI